MHRKIAGILTLFLLILALSPQSALAADTPLSEKTIVFLGDSIIGNYQDQRGTKASIPYLVSQMTGAITYNCAFGGASASDHPEDPYSAFRFLNIAQAMITGDYSLQEDAIPTLKIPNAAAHLQTLKDMDWNNVDLIVLHFGANDYADGVFINDPSDPNSKHTYQGALRSGIRTIQEAYPHIRFLICSVPPRFRVAENEDGTYTHTLRSPNDCGNNLADYVAAAEMVSQQGKHLFADLYHTGITEENAATYFHGKDGTHPALPGQTVAAEAIARALGAEPMLFDVIPATSAHFESHCWAARTGVLDETFLPRAHCTRAQAVSFLWKMAGCPTPAATAVFEDVPADAPYAKAVSWAVEQGITQGTSTTKFSPDRMVSRAQAVTFLWRMAGSPTANETVRFTDTRPNGYYAPAVSWAVAQGITSGYGDGCFVPDDHCSQSQIVTFLYRYAKESSQK